MKPIIIDNFLSSDLNEHLNNYLKNSIQFKLQKSSEIDEQYFLMGIFPYCPLMDFIFNKIKKNVKMNLKLERCYSNLQFPKMDGSFHIDDGDITCLYMVHGEGPFEIKDNDKIIFKEKRLIVFDAKTPHKGHAPKKGYRITLAFKTFVNKV
jgi:hypothetical protein